MLLHLKLPANPATNTEDTNSTMATATIPRITSPPNPPLSSTTLTSRLNDMWDDFNARMYRIEALERKLDARAIKTRRRLTNLLESHAGVWNINHRSSQPQRSRASHLRLFVTHRVVDPVCDKPAASGAEGGEVGSTTTTAASADTAAPTTTFGYLDPDPRHVVPHYLLHIEGKLLVGHLDHASATLHDASTKYTFPDDDLDRSRAEPEEAPDAVIPIHCTHLFAKLVVHLEPLYQPKPHPMSKKFLQQQQQPQRPVPAAPAPPAAPTAPQPTKKSARRGSTKSPTAPSSAVPTSTSGMPDAEEETIDPSRLVRGESTTLTWTPDLSPDAHLWEISYTPPNPPGHHLMPHSVVATIQLHPRRAEELYEPIHPVAAEKLFPHHRAAPEESNAAPAPAAAHAASSSSSSKSSKKRKADTDLVASRAATPTPNTEGSAAVDESAPPSSKSGPVPPPATEPSIHIPQGLTMGEIVQALYVYICDKQLQDPTSPSTIVCDDTLRSMFHVDRFPFDQLRQLLVRHNLFAAISHQPVELVYILKPETAVPTPTSPSSSNSAVVADLPPTPPDWHAALLQLDMDASVPDYFPFRCRELLRRIKRRELEYTSSRTKARYLLTARKAKAEEPLKHWLDAAIGGRAIAPHAALQPVLLALAKATPPKTEARNSAHLDARLSLLLERVKERQDAAATAWQLVEACRQGGGTDESGAPHDDNDQGNNGN